MKIPRMGYVSRGGFIFEFNILFVIFVNYQIMILEIEFCSLKVKISTIFFGILEFILLFCRTKSK